MKGKVSRVFLGCYDLLLAFGAIYNGLIMVLGKWWDGEWPDVWIGKVPFTSWFWPGVIAICIYGLGNLIAAYFSFSKKEKGWIASGVMGILFFLSLLLSLVVLGEGYLATGLFLILSVVQMILAGIEGIGYFGENNREYVRASLIITILLGGLLLHFLMLLFNPTL